MQYREREGAETEPVASRIGNARRRVRLAGEAALVYLGAPLAIHYAVVNWQMRVFALLALALPFLLLALWLDGRFDRRILRLEGTAGRLRAVGATFLVLAPLIALGTWLVLPHAFLSLPRTRPELWAMIVCFYPFVSALPQELLYRVLFFQRFRPLFGPHPAVAIGANASLFAFAHVIFGSWVSVAGAFGLGLLLAWRFERGRAFWPIWLEHALYGNLAFTVGLGRYFYLSAGG
ncbi:CPBP family intramembrane glutamic endopeptidase [Afifella sp. IM 167]|uniref:CPBP family intramembrane glutamic endopeptidase n=1 Tax=Afifella sp. IM 167 TaxID=2033586 RepID=UPI001CC9E45A|nr:CPBP family intramembrane glutamic endopeptidase [Afifella sp. IM 167]